MPAASTPDSAPEDAAQRIAAAPSEVTGALLVPSAGGCGSPENVALDELGDAGPAAPIDGSGLAMDRSDLDHGAFSLLDDAVQHSGGLADVVDTAAFWSGVRDSFQPLVGLSTMLSEFTAQANFGLAPALAGIELAVPRLPNIAEMVDQSLLNGLGARNAALSALTGVQPQILSLSETVNSGALRREHAGTAGRTQPGQGGLVRDRASGHEPGEATPVGGPGDRGGEAAPEERRLRRTAGPQDVFEGCEKLLDTCTGRRAFGGGLGRGRLGGGTGLRGGFSFPEW